MPRLVTAVALGALAVLLHAQEWTACPAAELVRAKKASDALHATVPVFSLKLRMASYRSATDAVPFEEVDAILLHDGACSRAEIKDMLTVQDADLRVIVDREERTLIVTDPVAEDDPYVSALSNAVIERAASCARRATPEGTEYRIIFPDGAVYDRLIVLYDKKGWLRRTVSFWRQGISEQPDDPGARLFKPKLQVDYELPRAFASGSRRAEMDTSAFIVLEDGTPKGIGPWTAFEIIDSRIRP